MRQSLSSLLVLACVSLWPAAAAAQTAEEIVARNIEAKGGYELLRRTASVRATARGTMRGQPVTTVTMSKRPFLMRSEMTVDAPTGRQKMVRGFDGETAWMAFGDGAAKALPAGPQTESLKTTSQIDSPLLDYKEKGLSVVLGEPVTDGGKKFHHLVVTPKDGPPMHYLIDPTTYLESRMILDVDQGGQQVRMEMRFDDYRKVEGRTVPFALTQVVDGAPLMRLTFDKVEFDVVIDDALFKMPR